MTASLIAFSDQKYLNLASYRKNGDAVATPVWFAQLGDKLFIYSLANAGKVKRIRNNPRVRIIPCDMRGKPLGTDWLEAAARLADSSESEQGHRLLDDKYGLLKRIGNLYSKLMNRERVVIVIEPERPGR